jgi:hypothetical protein
MCGPFWGRVGGVVVGEFDQRAVDAGADEAFAGETFEDVAELALLVANHGGEQDQPGARGQGEEAVDDVAGGLAAMGSPVSGQWGWPALAKSSRR